MLKRCPKCGRFSVEYNEQMRAWRCLVNGCPFFQPINGKNRDLKEKKITAKDLRQELNDRIKKLEAC